MAFPIDIDMLSKYQRVFETLVKRSPS